MCEVFPELINYMDDYQKPSMGDEPDHVIL